MMKRGLCALLAALLCLLAAASGLAEEAAGSAVEAPIARGTGWSLAQDGTLTIDGTLDTHVSKPQDVPWYDHMGEIVFAQVREGVTRLDHYCFMDAANLVYVYLPEGLKSIGMSCFQNCGKLSLLRLPSTLATIDYWAFSDCGSLREVVLSPAMKELSNYTFQSCKRLERMVALSPLERLGYDCLEGCSALRELYLPDTLKLIDQFALNECPALTDIHYAGGEAQWRQVEAARKNEDALTRAAVHCDSTYDPVTAPPIMAIQRGSGGVATLKGAVRVPYSAEDVIFIKGLLDDEADTLERSGMRRDIVEHYLKTSECLMYPGTYSAEYVPIYLLFKLTGSVMKHDTLQQTMDARDEADMGYLDKAVGMLGVSDPVQEKHGALEWLMYEKGKDHIALTVAKGNIVVVMAGFDPGFSEDARIYLNRILDDITLPEDAAPEAAATPAPTEAPADRAFTFMNGKLTVRISPEEYDYLVKDVPQDPAVLERLGLSESQASAYMSMLGYELVAVPVGQKLTKADFEILVNVKDPSYQGIASLRSLSEAERMLLAQSLVLGFGKSDYELYSSGDADYIVFEALGSQRYATIVDGCMVYIYAKSDTGILSDDQKAALRRFVDGASWKLG